AVFVCHGRLGREWDRPWEPTLSLDIACPFLVRLPMSVSPPTRVQRSTPVAYYTLAGVVVLSVLLLTVGPYRVAAAQSLEPGHGDAEVQHLIQALKSPEAPVRAGAAETLGKHRPKVLEAVPLLMEAMKDPVPAVRVAAAGGLGRL